MPEQHDREDAFRSLARSDRPEESSQFADEGLPSDAFVDGRSLGADFEDAFDYVVVGSGAAGAVAAHVLAESGASVALAEEGPWIKTREFGESVYDAFTQMYRDAGTQAIEGRAFIPMLQGRCVGGSTVMNSAIVHRLPGDVLQDWQERFELGAAITERALEPHFEAIERDLSARRVSDEALGRNNALFIDSANRSGLPAQRMKRYDRGCRGSARCLTGCPTAAKQGMNVTYVPWALSHGARIVSSCRVDRVVIEKGRATGVLGWTTEPSSAQGTAARRVRLHARRGVIVAASTVQTPNLLRRSGLRARAIGKHFQCHPGYAIAGVFESPVEMTAGATQGAESLSLRGSDRIKLETLAMPPELAAVRVPGVGQDLMRRFGMFAHMAVWAVVVQAQAEGTVKAGWTGGDRIRWTPTPLDLARTRKGIGVLARLMFQAGAREVWPGLHGLPSVLTSIDDVRLIDEVPLEPRLFGLIATHLFGACRMGPRRSRTAVGTDFQTHEAERLFVVDSSVFPTNLGVNPQHSIMAIGRLAATQIVDRGGARTKRH